MNIVKDVLIKGLPLAIALTACSRSGEVKPNQPTYSPIGGEEDEITQVVTREPSLEIPYDKRILPTIIAPNATISTTKEESLRIDPTATPVEIQFKTGDKKMYGACQTTSVNIGFPVPPIVEGLVEISGCNIENKCEPLLEARALFDNRLNPGSSVLELDFVPYETTSYYLKLTGKTDGGNLITREESFLLSCFY